MWNVHVRLNPLRVNNIERVGAREGPQTTLRHERFKEKLPGSTPSIARCCGINDPKPYDTGLRSLQITLTGRGGTSFPYRSVVQYSIRISFE